MTRDRKEGMGIIYIDEKNTVTTLAQCLIKMYCPHMVIAQ